MSTRKVGGFIPQNFCLSDVRKLSLSEVKISFINVEHHCLLPYLKYCVTSVKEKPASFSTHDLLIYVNESDKLQEIIDILVN